MNAILPGLRPLVSSVRRIGASLCVVAALVLGPAPGASASLLPLQLRLPLARVVTVSGSAENTITSLTVINDVTLAIEAEQVGYLTDFGNFTGHFSYLAIASPASILLIGNATLTNEQGEQLFLVANILELGTDYPRSVTGTVTVTGGTGRYAGAVGTIVVTGTDEESPTDTFNLNGALIILGL